MTRVLSKPLHGVFQGVSRSLSVVLVTLMLAQPAAAAPGTMESVVDVDTTASDATAARAQAMETVEYDALKALLVKMSPESAQAIAAKVTPQQASSMSTGMEVMEEKITSNRYRAKIKVKFSSDKVEALLAPPVTASAGTPTAPAAAPTLSGSFLVLPILRDGPNSYLWEGDNLWRSVWQSAALQYGQGRIIVPNGNQYDTALVDVANAFNSPFSLLQPMAERYGTSDVLVVEATYAGTDDAPELNLMARRMNASAREDATATYKAEKGETRETLLVRAANDMAKALSGQGVAVAPPPAAPEVPLPKSDAPAEEQSVKLTAPLYQISDWIKLRTRLKAVPLVEGVELSALNAYEAKILLHYKGDPGTLARQLSAAGFRVGTAGDGWSIQ